MARNIAWKVSGHDNNLVMHDTKQDIEYMYAQGWPTMPLNVFFGTDLYSNVGFPGKQSYSQLIEQSKKSSILNFVTNGYRTTPNIGVYGGASKTSGRYSFYREEVVGKGANTQITHRDPVAINTQSPQIIDYNIAANHTYKYTAYPSDMNDAVFATTAINPNATGSDPSLIQTPMINWSIAELLPVEVTTDIPSVKKEYQVNKSAVWMFKFNVSTGEATQNVGRDQVTNLAQYNKMAQGKRNYMSGTVSCYLGSELVRCTGEYTEEPRFAPLTTSNKSIAMLKAWRKFVASKNPKLLKDRKGNKYIVQLTSMSDRVDDNVPCQPSFINFNWQEIESCDDVLITGGYESESTTITGSTMQTIKLPTPVIHGAAFIGDTIWNNALTTPAFEDSYHFIFSIENDPLTDYYEWSLTNISTPLTATGYEKQTVRKKNIAPVIIPNSDGTGSLDNINTFQEGNKYMLRVRGRSDNSAIEDSNYYSEIIECKWLWGPNKYLELQELYYDKGSDEGTQLFTTNWGFAGLGILERDQFVSAETNANILTIGNAYNKNTISNWESFNIVDDTATIVVPGSYNIVSGDLLYYSKFGNKGLLSSSTHQFALYRSRANANGSPQATFKVNSVSFDNNNNISTFNCQLIQGSYSAGTYPQLWSYKIGTPNNEWDNIYPWSEIKRSCGQWENGYYKRAAYENDSKFTTDGSQGDVFVEYPLFYYADIEQNGTNPDSNSQWCFPFKYVYALTPFTQYPWRMSFIAQYPYHYGMPLPNTQPTTSSPTCLPSSLHINYQTGQTYAAGFLSAYELSKANGVYHSVSGQDPVTEEIGTNLLNNISVQWPGLVGLKYTDQNMLCLLMAMEFGTYNINLALSSFLDPNEEISVSKINNSRYEINAGADYNTYKSYFYPSQRVKLGKMSSSGSTIEDNAPYVLRRSGGGLDIGTEETDKLIGGTIAWQQMIDISTCATTTTTGGVLVTRNLDGYYTTENTATSNVSREIKAFTGGGGNPLDSSHVYFGRCTPEGGSSSTYYTNFLLNGSVNTEELGNGLIFKAGSLRIQIKIMQGIVAPSDKKWWVNLFDLTQIFGSDIADHVYLLEQSQVGSGIDWLKSYGFFTEDYYKYTGDPYDQGILQSVNASKHIMRDENNTIIGDYDLDSNITLNGLYKLTSDGKLYCDGDIYESNGITGTVTRKYEKRAYQTGDENLSNTITDGTNTVTILASPTSTSANAFTNPQNVSKNGTEQYVDAGVEAGTRDVSIPVGHETIYSTPDSVITYDTNQIGAIVLNDADSKIDLYLNQSSNENYLIVCPIEWKTGTTDSLSGTTNSLRGTNNMFAPCKYRGVENPFGNVDKLCSDMQGYSVVSNNIGMAECYYYKNANAVSDPGGTNVSNSGLYFISNTYVWPGNAGDNMRTIENANNITIGSYYIPAETAQVNNATVPGCFVEGIRGPADSSQLYAVQIGGKAPFTSYIDNTSYVPVGPFNIDVTEKIANAAFGTRFSTHRTHY